MSEQFFCLHGRGLRHCSEQVASGGGIVVRFAGRNAHHSRVRQMRIVRDSGFPVGRVVMVGEDFGKERGPVADAGKMFPARNPFPTVQRGQAIELAVQRREIVSKMGILAKQQIDSRL